MYIKKTKAEKRQEQLNANIKKIEDAGCKFLYTTDNTTKSCGFYNYHFQCPQGHELVRHSYASKLDECEKCIADEKRELKAIDNLKKIAIKKKHTIKSYDYKNKECVLLCENGHERILSFPVSKSQFFNCRQCYEDSLRNETIEKVKKICKEKGGEWIGGEYLGVYTNGKFRCSEGHIFESQFNNILTNKWCYECWYETLQESSQRAGAYNKAKWIFININKKIKYYRSRQNVFDDINREIKKRKSEIKKTDWYIEKKRKSNNIKYRESSRIAYSEKYKNNIEFRINERIKSQISKTITKDRSMGKYYDILGYRTHELKKHLESKFVDGMSWDNFGEWHIDHITPKSWFNFTNEDGSLNKEEFRRCWSLDNLQPLWAADNIIKNNRYAG